MSKTVGLTFKPEKKKATATDSEITESLKVDELRALGKDRGLSFPAGTTKKEMVAAINAAEPDDKE